MTWGRYWLLWFIVMAVSFLGPEIYALATNVRNTLSETVWRFEQVRTGEHIGAWTATHFLVGGLLLLLLVWLIGHLVFGMWR